MAAEKGQQGDPGTVYVLLGSYMLLCYQLSWCMNKLAGDIFHPARIPPETFDAPNLYFALLSIFDERITSLQRT